MTLQTSGSLIDAVLLSGAAETELHENLEQEEHTLKEVEKATKKQANELAGAAA